MRCLLVSIFLISLFLVGCATPLTSNEASPTQPSPFTHGNVQLTIRQNITTQAEILEKFGPRILLLLIHPVKKCGLIRSMQLFQKVQRQMHMELLFCSESLEGLPDLNSLLEQ